MAKKDNSDQIIIFKTADEKVSVDVRFEDETVWLTQDQMSQLFDKAKSTINEHISNIYAEGELSEDTSMRKFGNSEFTTKPTNYYNLDVIISVGYRVKSQRGTQFRQWATKRLNEYIRKGFTMDDERLKELGGGGCKLPQGFSSSSPLSVVTKKSLVTEKSVSYVFNSSPTYTKTSSCAGVVAFSALRRAISLDSSAFSS